MYKKIFSNKFDLFWTTTLFLYNVNGPLRRISRSSVVRLTYFLSISQDILSVEMFENFLILLFLAKILIFYGNAFHWCLEI